MEIKEKMVKLTIYAYYEVCEEFYVCSSIIILLHVPARENGV